jgi:hypothetical protein
MVHFMVHLLQETGTHNRISKGEHAATYDNKAQINELSSARPSSTALQRKGGIENGTIATIDDFINHGTSGCASMPFFAFGSLEGLCEGK